jgi:predicted dehydrogenase
MCEKPMATSVGDCVRMLRDVTSAPMSGKVFAIGHVMRYSPYNVAVREVIDSGVLGDIVDVQVSTTSMPRTQILTNSTQSRSGTSTLLTRLFGEAGARRRRARLPSCPSAAST